MHSSGFCNDVTCTSFTLDWLRSDQRIAQYDLWDLPISWQRNLNLTQVYEGFPDVLCWMPSAKLMKLQYEQCHASGPGWFELAHRSRPWCFQESRVPGTALRVSVLLAVPLRSFLERWVGGWRKHLNHTRCSPKRKYPSTGSKHLNFKHVWNCDSVEEEMIRNASFQSQQLIKQNEALANSQSCHPSQVINTSYCSIILVVNPSKAHKQAVCKCKSSRNRLDASRSWWANKIG